MLPAALSRREGNWREQGDARLYPIAVPSASKIGRWHEERAAQCDASCQLHQPPCCKSGFGGSMFAAERRLRLSLTGVKAAPVP